ncbi:WXG100 family type VII secretion target [Nocardia sp. 2YAB30]|uniref:WXG100 family type VII secretion target n=1 Tax=unclassified Nocardia TaxID=2637762 RepID=UPI003F9E6D6C
MRKMPRAAERATHRRTDPAYVPNVEIFDNLTHDEIHAKVQLLNPALLAGGQQAWADSGAGLADAIFQAHTEIRAAIADGWRGSAAESAVAVVRVFEQSGQDLADVLAVVSQRLGQASDAAEALRAAVSEPSGVAPDLAAALLDPAQATSNIDGQKEGEHARQDVVRAMTDIYAGVFIRTGTDVPAFPDEADDRAPDAPTGAPVAKVTGTGPKVSDAQIVSLDPTVQGTRSADPIADGAPTDQASDAAPATTAAGVTPTDTVVPADTPTNAPRVAPAAAEAPPSVVPAGNRLRTAPAASTRAATNTAAAAAAPIVVPTTPGTSNPVPAEHERKRDERRTDNAGNDAVTGVGAGAVGGLMGGALATTDTPRPGSSVAANAVAARTVHVDEEDDEFDLDDLPTYLEPSDHGGELIGSLDPTTPPVLGEWTEYE